MSKVNGSYVDELTRGGHLVWSAHLPIAYPSDPQQLGPDRYLVADYARPGGVYEFNRAGRILWSYHPASGAGMLDHPSLAERFPGGLIAVTDDYRDRVVLIDPQLQADHLAVRSCQPTGDRAPTGCGFRTGSTS